MSIDLRRGYGRGLLHRDDTLKVLDMAQDGDIMYFDEKTFAYFFAGGLTMFGPQANLDRIADFMEENT